MPWRVRVEGITIVDGVRCSRRCQCGGSVVSETRACKEVEEVEEDVDANYGEIPKGMCNEDGNLVGLKRCARREREDRKGDDGCRVAQRG